MAKTISRSQFNSVKKMHKKTEAALKKTKRELNQLKAAEKKQKRFIKSVKGGNMAKKRKSRSRSNRRVARKSAPKSGGMFGTLMNGLTGHVLGGIAWGAAREKVGEIVMKTPLGNMPGGAYSDEIAMMAAAIGVKKVLKPTGFAKKVVDSAITVESVMVGQTFVETGGLQGLTGAFSGNTQRSAGAPQIQSFR